MGSILGNPGVIHSVPTACSGYVMDHTLVTEDEWADITVNTVAMI